jgi:hypothetical protein
MVSAFQLASLPLQGPFPVPPVSKLLLQRFGCSIRSAAAFSSIVCVQIAASHALAAQCAFAAALFGVVCVNLRGSPRSLQRPFPALLVCKLPNTPLQQPYQVPFVSKSWFPAFQLARLPLQRPFPVSLASNLAAQFASAAAFSGIGCVHIAASNALAA